MPSTVTSYTTFQKNTKALSADVNTNFSNHRGDLVPINSDTASASDNTHNLGAGDHRWLTNYLNKIDFETSTTTATLINQGVTTNTTGAFEWLIEGSTVGAMDASGFTGPYKASSITRSAFSTDLTLHALTFTGSTTWVPTTTVTHAFVQIQGAGGGGGGGGGADGAAGGGGGGGGCGGSYVTRVVPINGGSTYNIDIGTGGSGGGGGGTDADGSAGNTGTGSAFRLSGSTLCAARGGNPGQGGSKGSVGTGGAGGVVGSPNMVGGGAGANSAAAGSNGNNSDNFDGGAGGASAGSGGGGGGSGAGLADGVVGGAGGASSSAGAGGTTGTKGAGGSGAGGGGVSGFSGNSGGTGSNGQIVVMWTQ
jgi:hypothetical protein